MVARIDIDTEVPDLGPVFARARRAYNNAAAREAGKRLRSQRSLWPVGTPTLRSKARWTGRYHEATKQIALTNSADYADIVNNRSSYKNGAPNPNHRAAQRTVTKFLPEILDAGRDAAARELNRG